MGRHQNLNPDSKISLNHANLNLVNLWAVVSQEFCTRFQQLVSFKLHVCDVVRVAQTDLVTVAAARGCGCVAGGCLRYGNWLAAGVTMICTAGRWLSCIALKIRCAGEHVLVSTNRLRTMCWLVVVRVAGGQMPRGAT